MKRAFGIFAVALGLIVASPVRLPTLLLVWLHYFRSSFHIAPRVEMTGQLSPGPPRVTGLKAGRARPKIYYNYRLVYENNNGVGRRSRTASN
jgi:hypothetical protein